MCAATLQSVSGFLKKHLLGVQVCNVKYAKEVLQVIKIKMYIST